MELNSDPLYSFVGSHTLPIYRNDNSVRSFLSDYYQQYSHDLNNCLNNYNGRVLPDSIYNTLRSIFACVQNSSNNIISFLDAFNAGKRKKSTEIFDDMMQEISCYLPVKKLNAQVKDRFHTYYRIRNGNVKEREELFHIPMSKRELIGAYRYSIPGQPCLYLANGLELCFFECGMPMDFSCSKFQLTISEGQTANFLDFSKDERSIIGDIYNWLYNCPEDKNSIEQYLCKFIVSFPLRAACSLSVKDRSAKFVEEYIIPQQLTAWIVERDGIDGILYQTCSSNRIARSWTYTNLVVPATNLTGDYCAKLKDMFVLTNPVHVIVRDKIVGGIYQVEQVKKVLSAIRKLYLEGKALDAYITIESLCQTFLAIVESLTEENYKNPEVLDSMLNSIMRSAHMLFNNRESIKNESMARCPCLVQPKEHYEADFDYVMALFGEAKDMMTYYSSYESIICNQIDFGKLSMEHLK